MDEEVREILRELHRVLEAQQAMIKVLKEKVKVLEKGYEQSQENHA
jgi:hypothetical protein